jgi:hypothetical protein
LDGCRLDAVGRDGAGFAPIPEKFNHGLLMTCKRERRLRDGECETTIRLFASIGGR